MKGVAMIKYSPSAIDDLIAQLGPATHRCPSCGQLYWAPGATCRGYIDTRTKKKYPHDKVVAIPVAIAPDDRFR